jgi:hypothetical protein
VDPRGLSYVPGEFKYVVVLLGNEARSTSGRLAHLIAHSGSVVLLQDSAFRYHFSSRLKPWVHYVPLNYAASDLAEKVAWLQSHDDLARKIVENARNFGNSYLRVEDYYCYGATALKTVSELTGKYDAHVPFHPKKMAKVSEEARLDQGN